jgi:hypothetical protein
MDEKLILQNIPQVMPHYTANRSQDVIYIQSPYYAHGVTVDISQI